MTPFAHVVLGANSATVSVSPDRIKTGTAQTITITSDSTIVNQEGLSIRLQDRVFPVKKNPQNGKITVELPGLRLLGKIPFEIVGNDQKNIAVGLLYYVEPTQNSEQNNFLLLFMYAMIIGLPPTAITAYDIRKTYKERSSERKIVLEKAVACSEPDMDAIMKILNQGPAGLTGLTRGIIAISLILVLVVAVLHIIVFQTGDGGFPPVAEKLLLMLAGALASVTGFYFGSRGTNPQNPSEKTNPENLREGQNK